MVITPHREDMGDDGILIERRLWFIKAVWTMARMRGSRCLQASCFKDPQGFQNRSSTYIDPKVGLQ